MSTWMLRAAVEMVKLERELPRWESVRVQIYSILGFTGFINSLVYSLMVI